MDKLTYRTGLYDVLAELAKEPDAGLARELPAMTAYLIDSFAALDYPLPPGALEDWLQVKSLERLQADYTRSFVFPPETRVVPVESVYRQWTFDPTVQLPFAREKGYLMSDAALHMQALYEGYGLTIPASMKATPDHLCLELEFASLLLTNGTADRYPIFLREHLDWVDELCREAEEKAIPSFYRQLLNVTARFLGCEREKYGG